MVNRIRDLDLKKNSDFGRIFVCFRISTNNHCSNDKDMFEAICEYFGVYMSTFQEKLHENAKIRPQTVLIYRPRATHFSKW